MGIGHDGHSTFTAYQTSGPTELPDFPWVYRRTATLVDLEVTNVHFLPKDEHCHRDSRFQKIVKAVRMLDEPDKLNSQYRYQPDLRQSNG